MKLFTAAFILLLALCSACSPKQGSFPDNNSDKEIITVYCDKDLRPALEALLQIYRNINKNDSLDIYYTSESVVLEKMLDSTATLIVCAIPEDFQSKEDQYLPYSGLKQVAFAEDAIVLAIGINSEIPELRIEDGRPIFTAPEASGNWRIILPGNNSGITRILRLDELSPNDSSISFYSIENQKEMLDYLKTNDQSAGFMSYSSITDRTDKQTSAMLKDIMILPLYFEKDTIPLYPSISSIKDRSYPLIRTLWLISSENNIGPAARFMNFAATEKGQRILMRSGFAPLKIPGRTVNFKDSGFN